MPREQSSGHEKLRRKPVGLGLAIPFFVAKQVSFGARLHAAGLVEDAVPDLVRDHEAASFWLSDVASNTDDSGARSDDGTTFCACKSPFNDKEFVIVRDRFDVDLIDRFDPSILKLPPSGGSRNLGWIIAAHFFFASSSSRARSAN